MSAREFENVNDSWKAIFRFEFGTVGLLGSILAFILLAVYLDETGGWSPRDEELGVTRGYFDYHPLLMGISFLLLMAPAVLSFELFPFKRHINKSIHGLLNTLGFLAALAGLAIIIDCHNYLGTKGSFHSVHGCVGLLTLILYFINLVAAMYLYVFQWGGSLRGTLKPFHKRLGLLTFTCGMATIVAGLMEDSSSKTGEAHQLSHVVAIVVYFTLAGVIFTICKFIDKKDLDDTYEPIVDNSNHPHVDSSL